LHPDDLGRTRYLTWERWQIWEQAKAARAAQNMATEYEKSGKGWAAMPSEYRRLKVWSDIE